MYNPVKPYFFIGSIISGIGGAISGAMNLSAQNKANQANIAMQNQTNAINREMYEKNLAWQKQQYQQQRQDHANAISTRVQDLKNNNLNPALAIGNAAGVASAPALPQFQQQAPSENPAFIDNPLVGFGSMKGIAEEVTSLLQMKESIAQTKAQTRLLEAQADKERAGVDLTRQQYESESWNTKQKAHDINISIKDKRRSNDSRSKYDEAIGAGESIIDNTIKGLNKISEKFFNKQKKGAKK